MEQNKTSIILPDGSADRAVIADIRRLGRGRAAEAWLVEVRPSEGRSFLCAEKRFAPGGLTSFIYHFWFQSPFPYATLLEAVECCLYRRKIAEKVCTWDQPDSGLRVSDALYVRLDDRLEGPPVPVLGTEFIDGMGLRPPRPEPRLFRKPTSADPVNLEWRRLVGLMRSTERRLIEAGLVGSGWQVATAALVTPANFLMTEQGRFVCVDLESGIPALLVPRYLFGFLGLGFPLFDDADSTLLRHYVMLHGTGMRQRLGDPGYEELIDWIDLLEEHQQAWKRSEIALFRHRLRLVKDKDLRARIRRRMADYLVAYERIDEERGERLRRSNALLLNRDIALSLLPTSLGRGLHRVVSNRPFRRRLVRFVADREARRKEIRRYLEKRVPVWLSKERITQARADALLSGGAGALSAFGHGALSHLTPPFLHRVLTDRRATRELLAVMAVALVSERFQYAFAKGTILRGLEIWEGDRRIEPQKASQMRNDLERGDMQEYLRCFGMHLALKLLEPLTQSVRFLGGGYLLVQHVGVQGFRELVRAVFTQEGFSVLSPEKIWVIIIALLLLNITGVLRTLYTLWRMVLNQGRGYSYITALTVGFIPMFGTLAYPFQMYRTEPDLSTFLLRDFMSRAASYVPIYGGKHTLTEIGLLSLSDRVLVVLKGFSLLADRTARLFRRKPRPLKKEPGRLLPRPSKDKGRLSRWWNRVVDACIVRACPEPRTPAPASNKEGLG